MDKVKPRKTPALQLDDSLHIKSQTIRTKLAGKADPVLVEIIAIQAEELAASRRNMKIIEAQLNALRDITFELGAVAQVAVDELQKKTGSGRKGVSVSSEEV